MKAWAAGIISYLIWGVMPLFWLLFGSSDSVVVLIHRSLWSMPFLGICMLVRGHFFEKISKISMSELGLLAASALLIGSNWGLYIYGVTHHAVLEMSLGYFFAPLLTSVLGVLFFQERLSRQRWLGVLIVTFGVLIYTWSVGRVPLMAIGLAITFSGYTSVRKMVKVPAWEAMFIESLVLFLIGVVATSVKYEPHVFGQVWQESALLCVMAGALTTIPLLLFSVAIRELPLTVLGMLNYISPTGKFVIAVFLLHEPFATSQLLAFVTIWLGILVFLAEYFKNHQLRLTN